MTARRIVRRPLDSLPEEDPRVTDAQGYILSADGETEAVITAGADGIPVRVSRKHRLRMEYPSDLTPVDTVRDLDAMTAMQIGVGRLLQTLKIHGLDLEAYLDNPANVQSRDFRLERVFFDWPRDEDDIDKFPSAVIQEEADRIYDHQDLQPILLEETLNVFRAGTVLRKVSHVTTTLVVTAMFNSTEERRGFAAAVERQLLVEPAQDVIGRRIVIREHFDRVARYVLRSHGSDNSRALEKLFGSVLRFDADMDRCVLVKAPPMMRPRLDVDM